MNDKPVTYEIKSPLLGNDSWYTDRAGTRLQYLEASNRAQEDGVAILYVASQRESAVFHPDGQIEIVKEAKPFALLREPRPTFYLATGDLPMIDTVLFALTIFSIFEFRRILNRFSHANAI